MPTEGLEADLEKILGALANIFASAGDTRAVAILAMSKASVRQTDYDNWNGGRTGYTIYLEVPQTLYHQLDVVEVDGDTVHRETPQEAHERLTMLGHEGVHIERVNAHECETPDLAKKCAGKLLAVLDKS